MADSVLEQRVKAATDKAVRAVYGAPFISFTRSQIHGDMVIRDSIVAVLSKILVEGYGYSARAAAATGRILGIHHTSVMESLRRSQAKGADVNPALLSLVQAELQRVDLETVVLKSELLQKVETLARNHGFVGTKEGAVDFVLRACVNRVQ